LTRATAAGDPRDNGLQAERTVLAWTRTSFAFLANGALLMVRDVHGSAGLRGLVRLVGVAVVLLVLVSAIGSPG
jgi:uncharacterized membrane protein YidH (DUF202 family)